MILTDLDAGTTYQVRVVAKNGGGYEAAATWLEFQTPGVGQSLEHSLRCCHNSLLSEFVKICYYCSIYGSKSAVIKSESGLKSHD